MKKLTYKHVNALTHAMKLLATAARRYGDDELIQELNKDIKRLADIRIVVQHNIANPILPFTQSHLNPMFNPIKEEACEVG